MRVWPISPQIALLQSVLTATWVFHARLTAAPLWHVISCLQALLLECASPAWHHEERFVPGTMTRDLIGDSQYDNCVCSWYKLVLAAEHQTAD